MTKKIRTLYLLIVCFFTLIRVSTAQTDPIVIKIGNRSISSSEFLSTYKRLVQSDSVTKENTQAFIQNYINYQLEVHEAEQLGRNNTPAFKDEIATYRKELASPYLADKALLERLIRETYERMREEVHVAHIFMPVTRNATPADTASLFNELYNLRIRIMRGEPFEQIAKNYSQDASSAALGGDLGFLPMPPVTHYIFESVAYNLPKGEISMPFRTDKGYHLLKVIDKVPARGKVKLAHILISTPQNATEADIKASKRKIDQVYELLKKGEPFDGICRSFSDDQQTKYNGGVRNKYYDAGSLINDKVADKILSLQVNTEFTEPIQTNLGWHIFKVVDKKGILRFDELAQYIREKINSDASRSAITKGTLLKRLMRENNFKEVSEAKALALDNFLKDRFGNEPYLTQELFNINGQVSKIKDFYEYVIKQQRQLAKQKAKDEKSITDWYNVFVEEQNLRHEEGNLELKYPEFRKTVQDYKDGILQKQMLEEFVIKPSLDSMTQVRFYTSNQAKYAYTNRVFAKVVTTDNRETMQQAKLLLAKAPYPLNRRLPDIYFEKNSTNLTPDGTKMLNELLLIMIKNRHYTVEVSGNADVEENETISADRAKKIVSFLINKGIVLTRIIEKDDSKFKQSSRTDHNKNMRVAIKFYSDSMDDVVKRFNAIKPSSLTAEEGFFKKGDNKYVDALNWAVGDVDAEIENRQVWLSIKSIDEPRPKTFKEARGQVIKEYQQELYNNWVDRLKAKYPVEVNQEELQRAIN